MVTSVPTLTDVPGSGDCLTTVPAGFDELLSCCSVTWKPLLRNRLSADACGCPLTSGTLTIFGPLETNSFTRVPAATTFPFAGLVLITKPFCTVALGCFTTVDFSPALVISSWACLTCRPFTDGTALPELPPPRIA